MEQSNQSSETNMALLHQDVGFIKARVDDISKMMAEMSKQFVSKVEFDPIKEKVSLLEKDVNGLEKTVWFASGGVGILVLVLKFAIK